MKGASMMIGEKLQALLEEVSYMTRGGFIVVDFE